MLVLLWQVYILTILTVNRLQLVKKLVKFLANGKIGSFDAIQITCWNKSSFKAKESRLSQAVIGKIDFIHISEIWGFCIDSMGEKGWQQN